MFALSIIIFLFNSQLFRSRPFRSVLCLGLEISAERRKMKGFKSDLMVYSILFAELPARKDTMTRMYSTRRLLLEKYLYI